MSHIGIYLYCWILNSDCLEGVDWISKAALRAVSATLHRVYSSTNKLSLNIYLHYFFTIISVWFMSSALWNFCMLELELLTLLNRGQKWNFCLFSYTCTCVQHWMALSRHTRSIAHIKVDTRRFKNFFMYVFVSMFLLTYKGMVFKKKKES